MATKAATTAPVPLLWKVSDRDNTLYLLGSLHLLKPSDYPLSGDVDRAFADAEKVVFEVALEELADPATAQKFLLAAGYGVLMNWPSQCGSRRRMRSGRTPAYIMATLPPMLWPTRSTLWPSA